MKISRRLITLEKLHWKTIKIARYFSINK